jgi:hypothetical protein
MIFVVEKSFSTFCAGENIEWQHILNTFVKKSYSEYSRVLCNKVQKMQKKYSPYLKNFHESVKSRRGGAKANIALARKSIKL